MQRLDSPSDGVGENRVIGIDNSADVPPSDREAYVYRPRLPHVGLGPGDDPPLVSLQEVPCTVGRPVIENDVLEVRVMLAEDGQDHLLQVLGPVKGGVTTVTRGNDPRLVGSSRISRVGAAEARFAASASGVDVPKPSSGPDELVKGSGTLR